MDIKSVLKKYGVTTYELAERMGIKQPSVMQYVNGNPTAKKLEDMARAIGCSPADFFSDWQGSAGNIDETDDKRQRLAPGQCACPRCGAAIQFTAFTLAVERPDMTTAKQPSVAAPEQGDQELPFDSGAPK